MEIARCATARWRRRVLRRSSVGRVWGRSRSPPDRARQTGAHSVAKRRDRWELARALHPTFLDPPTPLADSEPLAIVGRHGTIFVAPDAAHEGLHSWHLPRVGCQGAPAGPCEARDRRRASRPPRAASVTSNVPNSAGSWNVTRRRCSRRRPCSSPGHARRHDGEVTHSSRHGRAVMANSDTEPPDSPNRESTQVTLAHPRFRSRRMDSPRRRPGSGADPPLALPVSVSRARAGASSGRSSPRCRGDRSPAGGTRRRSSQSP